MSLLERHKTNVVVVAFYNCGVLTQHHFERFGLSRLCDDYIDCYKLRASQLMLVATADNYMFT